MPSSRLFIRISGPIQEGKKNMQWLGKYCDILGRIQAKWCLGEVKCILFQINFGGLREAQLQEHFAICALIQAWK